MHCDSGRRERIRSCSVQTRTHLQHRERLFRRPVHRAPAFGRRLQLLLLAVLLVDASLVRCALHTAGALGLFAAAASRARARASTRAIRSTAQSSCSAPVQIVVFVVTAARCAQIVFVVQEIVEVAADGLAAALCTSTLLFTLQFGLIGFWLLLLFVFRRSCARAKQKQR
jgi:hypothetical protein